MADRRYPAIQRAIGLRHGVHGLSRCPFAKSRRNDEVDSSLVFLSNVHWCLSLLKDGMSVLKSLWRVERADTDYFSVTSALTLCRIGRERAGIVMRARIETRAIVGVGPRDMMRRRNRGESLSWRQNYDGAPS